jgi:hypothetical protein
MSAMWSSAIIRSKFGRPNQKQIFLIGTPISLINALHEGNSPFRVPIYCVHCAVLRKCIGLQQLLTASCNSIVVWRHAGVHSKWKIRGRSWL